MKPLTLTPALLKAARNAIWFQSPETAIGDPARFAAYVMTFGDADDWVELRRQLGIDGVAAALDRAPPGIFDARSWAYWNLVAGRPVAPMAPERALP